MEKIRDKVENFCKKESFSLKDLLVKLYGKITFNIGPNPDDIIIEADDYYDYEEDVEPTITVYKLREPTLEEQIKSSLGELGTKSKERLLELLLKLKEENGE